ncbi:hypothetical protein [Zoogloea sp.]|uniref:hypothetical protein n=1 Tax=Zoogloea sp. TaxID=49181 RepID=UPI0035B3FF54
MKIPNTLPVTAEQSRAARFQLGLTQSDLIQKSDLPGWKLKQFETGRFVPDIPFLQGLREFYTSQGIQFAESVTTTVQVKDEITPLPNFFGATPAASAASGASFPFFLCSDLTEAQGSAITERILENDERAAVLLNMPAKRAIFGGLDDTTDAALRELFGRLAENYMLLARLQGRTFITSAAGDARTVADLVASNYAGSPLVELSATAAPTVQSEQPSTEPEQEDAE